MFLQKVLLLSCLSLSLLSTVLTYDTINGRRTSPVFPQITNSYDIDLDLSYEDQWRAVLTDFKEPLISFIESLDIKANITLDILDHLDYPTVSLYNKDFAEEIKAISSVINVSFTEVAALNLIYDITAQCTSILIQDTQENVYHARNLDFPWAPDLSKLLFTGRYFKNGELSHEAVSLVAYTGLITGVKPGAYSFSIDQYVLPKNATRTDNIKIGLEDLIGLIRRKLSPPYVVRGAFETIPDYETFIKTLQTVDTVSRAFYIVAGAHPGEGVVITKYRDSVENITTLDVDAGRWFIAQSNYIGDIPDPIFDDRATAARDWLNAIGQDQITQQILVDEVMSQYPVFNNETLHTTVMQPSTGYINTTIWGW